MVDRLVNPRSHLERDANAALGVVHPGDISRRVDTSTKQDGNDERGTLIIVQETIVSARANIAASSTVDLLYTIPTGGSTFDSLARGLYVPDQARLLFCRITSNANVTAGVITPQLEVTEGADVTTILLEEAQLSTTMPSSSAVKFDWDVAPQIASGSTVKMQVDSDGSLTPATLDVSVAYVLGYSVWV